MKGLFSLEWEEITILVDHDWCGKKRFSEEVIYELNFKKNIRVEVEKQRACAKIWRL